LDSISRQKYNTGNSTNNVYATGMAQLGALLQTLQRKLFQLEESTDTPIFVMIFCLKFHILELFKDLMKKDQVNDYNMKQPGLKTKALDEDLSFKKQFNTQVKIT